MLKNYRPITFLTAVDKLFEQLLSHQLIRRYGKTLNSKMRALLTWLFLRSPGLQLYVVCKIRFPWVQLGLV